MNDRNDGRRTTDRELKQLRALELSMRNFIAHYEDHPEERFAPRTRQLVSESREIFKTLDTQRAEARPRHARSETSNAA